MMGFDVIDTQTLAYVARVFMTTSISNIAHGENGDLFVTGAGHVWKFKLSHIY